MDSITADVLLKRIPARQQVRNALSRLDKRALVRFDRGAYTHFFGEESGRNFDSEAAGWARAYLKHGEHLEGTARAVFGGKPAPGAWVPTHSENQYTIMRVAAQRARKTMAGVCTDIARPFERLIATRANITAPIPDLASSAEQVRVMERACDLAKLKHHGFLIVLSESDSVDGFLLLSLAHVLGAAEVEDTAEARMRAVMRGSECADYVLQADAYLSAVRRWLGRKDRETALFALSIAVAGVPVESVRDFEQAHLTPEYALALTGAVVEL